MRDIDQIIKELKSHHPGLSVKQLKATHPADNNGIWFVNAPDLHGEIQLESSNGQCPFIIESGFVDKAIASTTIADSIAKIEAIIKFGKKKTR